MQELKDKLFSIYEKENAIKQNFESNTFLSIIGRSYDEDLISRVVAYSLSVDKMFIRNLVDLYLEKQAQSNFDADIIPNCEVYVACEKIMGQGRADIFVELVYEHKTVAVLTIENKIYSWEHDNQTQTYFDWVTKNYKHTEKMFFYLHPTFNISKAVCKEYVDITYSDLLSRITVDDYIIRDFKQHICEKLGDAYMTLDTNQIEIMDNLEKFELLISESKGKYKALQKNLLDKVEQQLSATYKISSCKYPSSDSDLLKEIKETNSLIGSYRLYKPDWRSENKYYFYVEIKFKDGKLDKVTFQQTVKSNSSSKNEYGKHIEAVIKEPAEVDGNHCVRVKQAFPPEGESVEEKWFTEDWGSRFVEEATHFLINYIEALDEVFQNFKNLIDDKTT